MIGIIQIITSVNIFTGIILIIVTVAIVFEIKSLKKSKPVKKAISVPDYDKNQTYAKVDTTEVVVPESIKGKEINKNKQKIIIILGIIAFISLMILIINIFFLGKESNKENPIENNISVVKSSGIHLFDTKWNPIDQKNAMNLIRNGQTIYIGIESIGQNIIDKARIRINESSWSAMHETTLFKKENNMYYTEYNEATVGASLIIEAQLHSKDEGWLGN